jgi:hypothetical protein
MAMCKNCPALKEFPELEVIEYYAFGNGCPDADMDIYGGDCYSTFAEDDYDYEEDEFDKFAELYDFEEVKAEGLAEIREQGVQG